MTTFHSSLSIPLPRPQFVPLLIENHQIVKVGVIMWEAVLLYNLYLHGLQMQQSTGEDGLGGTAKYEPWFTDKEKLFSVVEAS